VRFMQSQPTNVGRTVLESAGWIGDVQLRPYSSKGPITVDTGIRAVTVFEIAKLVTLAQKRDKAVLLVAGPCAYCGRPKAEALRPLLEEPSLAIWTDVVLDVETAMVLLEASHP